MQRVSVHSLAGFIEGVLHSVEMDTGASPERIDLLDDGGVFVHYDSEPTYLVDKADMVISERLKEFHKKHEAIRVVELKLEKAPEGEIVNWLVVPIVWEVTEA